MAKIFGGSASRLEVYALFAAAVVLIGGGVAGAVALSQSDSNSDRSNQTATDPAFSNLGEARSETTDAPGLAISPATTPGAAQSNSQSAAEPGAINTPSSPNDAFGPTSSTSSYTRQGSSGTWRQPTTTTTGPPLVCAGRNVLDGFSATDGNWFARDYGALGRHIASLNPPGCPYIQFGFKPCISYSIDPNVYQVVYVETYYLQIGVGANRFDLGYASLGDECALQ
jgi:hypothetical protein